ncbi:hypothetical protein [Treponema sp.]|uniref:hypothetical protein n=1 Tax=Treponema sp. TaxID=166 RepID=UPI00388F4C0D
MNIKDGSKENFKQDFFDGFFNEFTKYPFGSMSKRDLECLIFSLMDENGLIEGSNNRDKAYNLGINTTRLNSYMVDANVKFGKKADENSITEMILNKLLSNSVTYEDNYFIFAEENPVLREDFIQAMKNKGYYTDTSHNKEIIKVKAVAILDFLTESKETKLLKRMSDKADFENQKLKDFFISQKSWKDIAKDVFGILKDSEGDAIKLLTAAAQYSSEFVKAKNK